MVSLSVFPPLPPFVCLSGSFLGIVSLLFSETEAHVVLCTSGRFFEKTFFSQKFGENAPKIVFLNLLENVVIIFFNKENLYYLLYSCTYPILKSLVPKICAKMILTNHIAGFLSILTISLVQNDEKA